MNFLGSNPTLRCVKPQARMSTRGYFRGLMRGAYGLTEMGRAGLIPASQPSFEWGYAVRVALGPVRVVEAGRHGSPQITNSFYASPDFLGKILT